MSFPPLRGTENGEKVTDHEKSIGLMRRHAERLKKASPAYLIVFAALSLFAVIAALINYLYFLKVTHRIAGPVYVIQRHIQDILDGTSPSTRSLRKNDELKELYDKVLELSKQITIR